MNIIVTIILSAILASIFVYVNYRVVFTTRYKIYDEKIPESFNGYKILHLSDWHCTYYGKNNKRLVNKINKLDVDAIFISGDFIVRQKKQYRPALEFIRKINKKPIYFIMGNHELTLNWKILGIFISELESMGVHVLENRKEYINIGEDRIVLYGLRYNSDDNDTMHIKEERVLKKYINGYEYALGIPDQRYFNILLTHDPLYFEAYAKMGYDLVYAGHLHGGAIRFFGLCLAKLKCGLIISKLGAGMKKRYNTRMIVSRGLGNSTIPVRIFDPPEMSITTLYNKKS